MDVLICVIIFGTVSEFSFISFLKSYIPKNVRMHALFCMYVYASELEAVLLHMFVSERILG